MDDHPAADQPDPIASPGEPDQALCGPQWARAALANEHDSATKARRISELPQSEFMGSGLFPGDGRVIPDTVSVDEREDDDDHDDEQEVDQ